MNLWDLLRRPDQPASRLEPQDDILPAIDKWRNRLNIRTLKEPVVDRMRRLYREDPRSWGVGMDGMALLLNAAVSEELGEDKEMAYRILGHLTTRSDSLEGLARALSTTPIEIARVFSRCVEVGLVSSKKN